MMIQYSSTMVVSGFLGFKAINERIKGEGIASSVLKLASMSMESIKDPLLLIFG
jgi:hypothetical protein